MKSTVLICLISLSFTACAERKIDLITRPAPAQPTAIRVQEPELAILARLEHEIELLKLTVREAEASAHGARVQFDYAQLRLDLDTIRLGIRAHRVGELSEPRAIEALSGDYR
jgi:RAQPRD family integrative conjugative element protein